MWFKKKSSTIHYQNQLTPNSISLVQDMYNYISIVCIVCISTVKCINICVFHHQNNQADKRTVAGLKELQQELERIAEECKRLKEKLVKTEAELQSTVEE